LPVILSLCSLKKQTTSKTTTGATTKNVYLFVFVQNRTEVSLDDCLRLFMKEEELEAEERPVRDFHVCVMCNEPHNDM
jgi:ubiquitin C-terminal hydrolase